MNRLLVLSCSQRKRTDRTSLPAIQRYDGPAFRLLRRYLENSIQELEIYILSAEFGLIRHTRLIPFYDQCMTNQRAHELKVKIAGQARRLFAIKSDQQRKRQQLFINLGRDYFRAFEPVLGSLASRMTIKTSSGATGKRLAEMYDWLYGKQSELHQPRSIKPGICSTKLHGIEIRLTKKQIFEVARTALRQGDQRVDSFQAWYVPVDNTRVSPKWLVSLLTNLPTSAFHSDDARRVLFQLGMEVIRI
jgi:hypothetical protein